jgi:hypothetical protein
MAKQRESNPKPERRTALTEREPLLSRLWPLGLFVILSLVFHWRILTSPADQLIATLDIVHYFRWLHMYAYEEFMAGRMPLWNPYTYCGTPFAANPQASVFYPLAWLYMVVDIFQAQKLMFVSHSMLAGSFMYLFLREIGRDEARDLEQSNQTIDSANESEPGGFRRMLFPNLNSDSPIAHSKMARPAAAIGAIAFMFGNYMMANVSVGHLTMVFTATWLPLALFCYERALSRGRTIWLMWTGMVLGVQVLAGEPQNCYYSVVAVTLYGLARTLMCSSPGGRRWWKRTPSGVLGWGLGLTVVAVVSAGASLIQLLPTAEFARLSDRSTNNYIFATFMSQEPQGFLEFLVPWANEDFAGIGVKPWGLMLTQNWEYGAYLGMVTLTLVGTSFFVRRNPALWSLRVLLVLAVVMMLGANTPVYQVLYEWMPGLSLFRIPTRAVVIAHLCLAAMAGIGAQHLFADERELWRRKAWLVPSFESVRISLMARCGR